MGGNRAGIIIIPSPLMGEGRGEGAYHRRSKRRRAGLQPCVKNMQIDESKAMEEVRGLSENTRRYLQILWRNQLQAFLSAIELNAGKNTIRDEVWHMSNSLRRLGL